MIKFNETNLDAEMVIGDTGTFSLSIKINNEQMLKTGDTVYFTLRKLIDQSIILQKTITEFEDGVCQITLEAEETGVLEEGNYLYDLKLVREDGTVDSLIPNRPFAYFIMKRGVK